MEVSESIMTRSKTRAVLAFVCLAVLSHGHESVAIGKISSSTEQPHRSDVVIYGGTAGGIIAAISAAREGAKVVLLEPTSHLGGMVTGGLGRTDIGLVSCIGGMSDEFYRRMHEYYQRPKAWKWETRDELLRRSSDKQRRMRIDDQPIGEKPSASFQRTRDCSEHFLSTKKRPPLLN
jgi:hypothetical protein